MENTHKIENSEAISILIIIMINKLILNIPYYIVDLVGTGSIINIIYIGIIDYILMLLIIKLLNSFDNFDIIDISEYLGGKVLKYIIGIISIVIFFIVSFITLIDFSNVLHTIYFSTFPMIYILFYFITGILISNLIGLKSISRTISFIVPFLMFSVFITFFTAWEDLDLYSLTPILGDNLHQTFITGLSNCFAMYIVMYLYYFKPLLKEKECFKKISIISYIISFILLILIIIPMLSLFNTNTNSEPINSLFLFTRQIELGKFLQRVDALFIFLWIFAIFSYLSFILFLINRIISKMIPLTDERMLAFSTSSILFGLTLIPINIANIHFIEDTIYKYLIIGFTFIVGIIILIFANIKKKRSASSNQKFQKG